MEFLYLEEDGLISETGFEYKFISSKDIPSCDDALVLSARKLIQLAEALSRGDVRLSNLLDGKILNYVNRGFLKVGTIDLPTTYVNVSHTSSQASSQAAILDGVITAGNYGVDIPIKPILIYGVSGTPGKGYVFASEFKTHFPNMYGFIFVNREFQRVGSVYIDNGCDPRSGRKSDRPSGVPATLKNMLSHTKVLIKA